MFKTVMIKRCPPFKKKFSFWPESWAADENILAENQQDQKLFFACLRKCKIDVGFHQWLPILISDDREHVFDFFFNRGNESIFWKNYFRFRSCVCKIVQNESCKTISGDGFPFWFRTQQQRRKYRMIKFSAKIIFFYLALNEFSEKRAAVTFPNLWSVCERHSLQCTCSRAVFQLPSLYRLTITMWRRR